MPVLSAEANLPRLDGIKMGVNYGGNKTRFISAVKVGKRVRGRFTEQQIADLARGVVVDGIEYRGAEFTEELEKGGRTNSWYRVVLTEGKNREIRKLVQHYGGMVNRLIRTQYGPFKLDKIDSGEMIEVPQKTVALLVHNLKADGSLK